MSKLYAELKSDKGGRIASKGGDEYIMITVRDGNHNMFDITFKSTPHDTYVDVMTYASAQNTRVHYLDPQIPF